MLFHPLLLHLEFDLTQSLTVNNHNHNISEEKSKNSVNLEKPQKILFFQTHNGRLIKAEGDHALAAGCATSSSRRIAFPSLVTTIPVKEKN